MIYKVCGAAYEYSDSLQNPNKEVVGCRTANCLQDEIQIKRLHKVFVSDAALLRRPSAR